MTSMVRLLERRRERQQRDVARLLDGVGQPPLVRGADTGYAARDDLAALRHEGVQQLDVLVIDVVDLFHAKPANFLAAEIRFLLRGYGLVAAGGALSGAAGSSFEFWHGISLRLLRPRWGRLIGQAGHGRRAGAFAHHLLRYRGRRRGRRGNGLAMRPLVALLFALFEALQRLVDAHGQKLDDQVRDAQTALELLDGFGTRGELDQD